MESYHTGSPTTSYALRPFTSQWNRSGYCVVEWFPQIVIFLMSFTDTSRRCASCVLARLWSRRVIAVKRRGSRSAALLIAIRALVLAGLPTTSTFTSFLAERDSDSPCGLKMPPLADSRSARSMPALRGIDPTRMAMSASPNAVSASSVHTTSDSSGKAQSSSSIRTPSSAPSAGVISSSWSDTGVSGPSIEPEAIRNRRL